MVESPKSGSLRSLWVPQKLVPSTVYRGTAWYIWYAGSRKQDTFEIDPFARVAGLVALLPRRAPGAREG